MLACVLFVAVALVTVRGCRFPPGHPSFSEDSQNSVHVLGPDILHVYTTEFGDCSGCVYELNLCYAPMETASSNETILTIFIISSGNIITRVLNVTVDPVADRSSGGNCRADGLAHPYCCVTQILEPSEQFMVNSNSHYAMKAYMGVSLPLVHISEQTSGYTLIPIPVTEIGSSVAYNSPESVKKPMFYFKLAQGDCPAMIPSPEPFQVFYIKNQKPTTSVQVTPTAALSVAVSLSPFWSIVVSHSPPHTEDGGDTSSGVSINDSLFAGVGVGGALMILIMAPVIIISVLVCLRRRKNKLNTADYVAYYMTASLDPPNTNEVCNSPTSSNEGTDIPTPICTNPVYTEVGNNGLTSYTDMSTSTNLAYEYVDDIPMFTNQSYLGRDPHQCGSDTLSYDYIHT